MLRSTLLLALALPGSALAGSFAVTNLTSDGAVPAAHTDPNLKNPWGISFSPTGPFWVSDNNTGLSTIYDGTGTPQSLVVTIPAATSGAVGSPTGQAFNGGNGFVVAKGKKKGPAAFLFATEDGTISGWSFGVDPANAIITVNLSSKGAVFKGLALGTDTSGAPALFAADLHGGVVDVFDQTFKQTTSFRDASLPAVYAPFNVAVLGGKIYVAYAWVNAQRNDVIPHPGWGVVEQVDATGKVLAKVQGGKLNAPWGLAIAPAGFGAFGGDLLVGNFGDGRITAYTASLVAQGQLRGSNKKPLVIDGLWGLIAGNGGQGGSASDVYFAAGINKEADGLFGSIGYTK